MEIDRTKNYQGIPPYTNPVWKSVYDGVSLEMHIVDHCNLNCAGCNHFSPLAEPWYIDLDDFRNQITFAYKKIPNIKLFMILGGEPTLHPKLFEICQIAREVFPKDNVEIKILSNGCHLQDAFKHEKEYKDMGVIFDVTTYGKYTDHKAIEYLDSHGLGFNHNSRLFMRQQLVNEAGTTDINEVYFHKCPHQLPCFTLKNYKIYICPFSAHLDIYRKKYNVNIPEDESDYLRLEDINSLDDLHNFIFKPKNICRYCDGTMSEASWIWHKYYDTKSEFIVPMEDAYFRDYDFYLKLVNDKENFLENYQLFKENRCPIEFRYNTYYLKKCFTRFIDGKMDIIIPYYNMNDQQIINLYNNLSTQTIIKDCCVYFISDHSFYDKKLIEVFDEANFPCFFFKNLKRKGPGLTRNLGLEYSFNKYVLFWDSDDLFPNDNVLEILYNLIKHSKEDFGVFKIANADKSVEKINLILKRDFLDKNNIKYSKFFFGEDSIFLDRCDIYGESYELEDQNLGLYITQLEDNPNCLSHSNSNMVITGYINKIIVFFANFIDILKLENIDENRKQSTLRRNLYRIINEIKLISDLDSSFYGYENNYFLEKIILLIYYVLYTMYNLSNNKEDFNNIPNLCNLDKQIIEDIKNQKIEFNLLRGECITNFDDIKNEIYPLLNYLNNELCYVPTYEWFLNYLDGKGESIYD